MDAYETIIAHNFTQHEADTFTLRAFYDDRAYAAETHLADETSAYLEGYATEPAQARKHAGNAHVRRIMRSMVG